MNGALLNMAWPNGSGAMAEGSGRNVGQVGYNGDRTGRWGRACLSLGLAWW